MRRKRHFMMSLMSLLLVSSFALAACSNGNNNEPSKAANTGNAKNETGNAKAETGDGTTTEKHKPVTLNMSWWGTDSRHQAIIQAVKQFEQKYDWIKVNTSYAGWDGYHDKLTVQLSTGKAPDLFAYSTNFLEQYGQGDVLLNYYDVQKSAPFLEKMNDTVKSNLVIGGKLFGIPAGLTVGVVAYDKKVFDEAKVPYPTDDDSWVSLADKLKQVHAANPKIWGEPGSLPGQFLGTLDQLTGQSPFDWTASPPTVHFDPATSEKFWTWVEQLWKDGVSPGNVTEQIGFDSGNVAAVLGPSSGIASNIASTKDPLGFAATPKSFDGTGQKVGAPPGYPALWGIPAKSKHPEETLLLLNYLLTDHDAVKTIGLNFGPPAYPDSLDYYEKEVAAPDSPDQIMLSLTQRAQAGADRISTSPVPPPGYSEALDAFNTTLESYAHNQIDMKKFLSEAEKEMNDKLSSGGK